MLETADRFSFEDMAERNFIGGQWKFTREGYEYDIYDPANCTVIATVPLSTHRDIRDVVETAEAALAIWSKLPRAERVAAMTGVLVHLRANLDHVATVLSRDTGLPVRQARTDLSATLDQMQVALAGSGTPDTSPGIIGEVLSWSNPLAVALRNLTLDLANGNVAIVNPSIRAPLSLVCLGEAFDATGVMGGVFNIVQGAGIDVGMALARRPELKRLDFQGASATARMVALTPRRVGIPFRALLRSVQSVALDTGSDLDAAAGEIASRCFVHAGVPGYGGLEVTLPTALLGPLADRLTAAFAKARYGSLLAGEHVVGPMTAEKFRGASEALVGHYVEQGAKLVCAAPAPDHRTYTMGWFVRPHVLHDSSGALRLNPDEANGPLVLLRTQ